MSESRNLRDEDVRTACMAHLSILEAEFGVDIPYRDGLDRGFPFRGKRVPFLSHMKGIYRSAIQEGPAALSIQTSWKSPYDDEVLDDGFLYAYRAGDGCGRPGRGGGAGRRCAVGSCPPCGLPGPGADAGRARAEGRGGAVAGGDGRGGGGLFERPWRCRSVAGLAGGAGVARAAQS